MIKVYACLTGNWVCLNEDPNSIIGVNREDPLNWWKNGADIHAPITRENSNSLSHLDYVNLSYKGKDYRISPIFIQIVTEKD